MDASAFIITDRGDYPSGGTQLSLPTNICKLGTLILEVRRCEQLFWMV